MAGIVLFEKGPHASRTGFRGEFSESDWAKLRAAAPDYVPDEALTELARKIMLAEADAKQCLAFVPLRDQLAQLKKLKRIAKLREHVVVDADGREHLYAELADALAKLDQDTFERITAADRATIQAILDRDGVFVDVDGAEHHFMLPATEVVRPHKWEHAWKYIEQNCDHPACRTIRELSKIPDRPASVWLPRGIEGFRESVSQAIEVAEAQKDEAGRREKNWQGALVEAVVEFWHTYCPSEPQGANHERRTGWSSPMVNFGRVVFLVVGESLEGKSGPLSMVTLSRLLQAGRRLQAERQRLLEKQAKRRRRLQAKRLRLAKIKK